VAGIKNWAAGNKDVAVRQLEKAATMNPTVDFYYRELSQIYLLKLNDDANRTDLSQEEKTRRVQLLTNNMINAATIATNLNPSSVDNWSGRGFIYQNLTGLVNGADEWAIKSYDEAIKLEPINPYYPVQKGMVYMRKALSLAEDKKDEKEQVLLQAKEQFEKALEIKSDYATARFQLAMVYQAQGKTDEAIKGLENTKQYAPNDIGLAFQLGILYYQNKDFQKAQSEFERAVGISPNYSNALYFLGLTYDQQGEKAKAIEKMEKVVELNPDNIDIKKVLENLKAGRNALEGIAQEAPLQAPIEEASPGGPQEKTKK
jgi:cytochrome c-type biogenesis protein CcmH/NrfG